MLLSVPTVASFAETSTVTETGDDVYAAGPTVHVLGDVTGDVVVAGGVVTVVNSVSQDIIAAGGSITITANVGDDLRAAGGSITVTGNVGGDALMAGGNVILGPGTVAGHAWLAGGNVTVAASVGGHVKIAAGHVLLSGRFDGNVDLLAQSITIQDSATIKGKLTYTSPNQADISDGAQIQGPVTRRPRDSQRDAVSWTGSFLGKLIWYLSLAVSAGVMYWLAPGVSRSAMDHIETQALKSSALGILVVIAAPVAVLMLLVSILGIPLGLALLSGYLVLLLVGYLAGLTFVGTFVYRRFGKQAEQMFWTRTIAILLGAGVLFVLSFVPVLATLTCIVVIVMGAGALTFTLYESYRHSHRPRDRLPNTNHL